MGIEDKPTLKYINSLKEHLSDIWRPTWEDWAKRDSYYFQTFELWPPEMAKDRPTTYPGRSRQIVDSASDHQLAFEPKPHRYPTGKGEEHKAHADSVEEYLRAVYEEMALLEPIPVWKAAGKNLIHLGYTAVEGPILEMRDKPKKPVRRKSWDDEDWEDALVLWENSKKTWMPFRTRVPSPTSILLDPENLTPRHGIKHSYRFSQNLYEITSRRKKRGNKVDVWEVGENPFELILTDEYWTPYWHALSVTPGPKDKDGRLLIAENNNWGFVPLAHAFAGWGQIPTKENQNDPKWLATGILSPIMDSLKLQAQATAGLHNSVMEATFPTMGTNIGSEEVAEQRARGSIMDLPDKGSVWWNDTPNLPNWLFEVLHTYDQDIELGSMSRSLSGQRQVGVSSVGQEAMLSTAAANKFVTINNQVERLATVVGNNILRLIDVIGEKLYCHGYELSPKEIEHDYSLDVTLELVDPVLQLQRQELGLREIQAGVLSKESYWSGYSRLEDGTGERRRLLEDFVRAHPSVQTYLAELVAREMGLGDILERQEEAGGQEPAAPIYGPDGLPLLGGSMGRAPVNGELRQPLNGNTAKPGRVNPAFLAGR